jgi:ABC-type cobalamin/Fe3+-siderophores transport system ATPase subunit
MIKLKTFEIKTPFKNLDSLKLDFEKTNGVTVLIGNNGSGKSNVIEALSSVFAGLYDHALDPTFSYEITYEKDDSPITISYDHSKGRNKYQYSLNDPQGYLPSQIISIYSGEELRLWNRYYFKFYNSYMKDVISSKKPFSDVQKMVFINKYYWNIALLTMLVSDLEVDDILGDKTVQRIEFEFNNSNKENITNYNDRSPNNVTRFAADILRLTNAVSGHPDRRIISLNDFKRDVSFTHRELFKLLSLSILPKESNWKLINKIELFFEGGYSTEDLSEGEKKQILIKFITRIFSDENSLFLMDEPDSHIHICNKEKIKDLLYDLESRAHVQSILTTHSPTLTNCFENENVYMLVNKDGKIQIEDKTKQEIVNDLTSDFWNLQEQNIFNSSQTPISLFVEGKHDKMHIQHAFEKLKSEYNDLSFDIFNMNSACNIPPMMLGLRTSEVDYGKLFIGIFDDDETGRTELSNTQSQFPNVQNKKRHNEGFYAFKYPKHTDHKSSAFTVENMFDSNHFEEAYKEALIEYQFNGKSLDSISEDIKDKAKNILAEKSKNFDKEDFKYFRAIFDQIRMIKENFEAYKTPQSTQVNNSPSPTPTTTSSIDVLFKRKGVIANGKFNPLDQSLIVMAGSQICKEFTNSSTDTLKASRADKLANKYKNETETYYVLSEDIEFETPSGAAVFVNAGFANGWKVWKDSDGKTLDELIRKP